MSDLVEPDRTAPRLDPALHGMPGTAPDPVLDGRPGTAPGSVLDGRPGTAQESVHERSGAAPDAVLDWAAFARTKLETDPFPYLVVPGFVPPALAAAAGAAFPGPDLPGVLPAPAEAPADAFGRVLRALRDPATTEAFAEKFGLALESDTLMITLRARTRAVDGRIHTDSETKVVTALLYLNDGWTGAGGRLRLLRGPDDIEDMIAEVPPLAGTLLAFRRTPHSWHGHKPFEGTRKAVMFNWMVDAATARRELRRHAVSASLKHLFG